MRRSLLKANLACSEQINQRMRENDDIQRQLTGWTWNLTSSRNKPIGDSLNDMDQHDGSLKAPGSFDGHSNTGAETWLDPVHPSHPHQKSNIHLYILGEEPRETFKKWLLTEINTAGIYCRIIQNSSFHSRHSTWMIKKIKKNGASLTNFVEASIELLPVNKCTSI